MKKVVYAASLLLILAVLLTSCEGLWGSNNKRLHTDYVISPTYRFEKDQSEEVGFTATIDLFPNISFKNGDKVYVIFNGSCSDYFGKARPSIIDFSNNQWNELTEEGWFCLGSSINNRRIAFDISGNAASPDMTKLYIRTWGKGVKGGETIPTLDLNCHVYINPTVDELREMTTIRWYIDNDTLHILGEGDMDEYRMLPFTDDGLWHSEAPWIHRQFSHVVIEEGITYIGSCMLGHCTGGDCGQRYYLDIRSISLPSTLKGIGYHGLWKVAPPNLVIPASVTEIAPTSLDKYLSVSEKITLDWTADDATQRILDGLYWFDDPDKNLMIYYKDGTKYIPGLKGVYDR